MNDNLKAVEKFRMLRFFRVNPENHAEKQTAIITQYNGSYRVLDHNNKEFFYSELTNSIKFLLEQGFIIENLFGTCYKYPEDNRPFKTDT